MQPNVNPVDKNSREYLSSQVRMGRYALLLVLILTVINLVLLVSGTAARQVVFSATIPYYLTVLAALSDAYAGTALLNYAIVIDGVFLMLYLLCWFYGGEKPGLMMAGFGLFALDTLALLLLTVFVFSAAGAADVVMDIFIHGWVLWQLYQGCRCGLRLKNEQ